MKKKSIALIAAIAVIVTVAVGGTLAWLVASSDTVTNTFVAGDIDATIEETFDGTTKKDVYVKVTGNAPALVRAVIVVNWADKDGNVSGTPVTTSDYDMDIGSDWTEIDNYYYYNGTVQPDGQTKNLIDTCTRNANVTPPAGYDLQVTILAEAIQAEGGAAAAAWGHTFSNGSWS